MKYTQWEKRMLSLFLGIMMLLCSFAVPAMAQEDWTALVVTLSWTDLSGNYMSVTATPVEGSDQTFWATVTAADVFSGLTLNVYHPYHTDYVFNPADGTIISAMDTGADMDASKAITIMAYQADGVTVADMYTCMYPPRTLLLSCLRKHPRKCRLRYPQKSLPRFPQKCRRKRPCLLLLRWTCR